jgi:hypothetical protein
MHDVEVEPEAAHELRKQRPLRVFPGDDQPPQRGGMRALRLGAHELAHALQHRGGQLARHHLVEQALRDRVLRAAEDLQRLTLLDHLPVLHHRQAVRHLLDDLHLVGDHDHRKAQLGIDLAQQRQDGMRGLGVQRRGGLVGEQHLGAAREGAGNAHALLLATTDLRGISVGQGREPNQFQQRPHPLADLAARAASQLQRQRNVVVHRARAQQVEVLEDHADAAARLAQLGRREFGKRLPVHQPRPRVGRLSRLITRTSELLPAPLRPITPNTSPARTCRLTPRSACTGPEWLAYVR